MRASLPVNREMSAVAAQNAPKQSSKSPYSGANGDQAANSAQPKPFIRRSLTQPFLCNGFGGIEQGQQI
jgi:hypothetical protein